MKFDAPSVVKRIVDRLNSGMRAAACVVWTSWKFMVAGPNETEVCDASFDFEKDAHRHTVSVEEKEDDPVTISFDFLAYQFNERYAYKYRVACATVGGLPLLRTAAVLSPATSLRYSAGVQQLRTDGVAAAVETNPRPLRTVIPFSMAQTRADFHSSSASRPGEGCDMAPEYDPPHLGDIGDEKGEQDIDPDLIYEAEFERRMEEELNEL